MKSTFFIGIDMANQDFTVAIFRNSLKSNPLLLEKVPNNDEGYHSFIEFLEKNKIPTKKSLFCMEHCGVYGEKLCHFLWEKKLTLAIEDPVKIRRAFKSLQPKTDVLDAIRIAQYAFRFNDDLNHWEPKTLLVDKIQSLLALREQLVKQSTALKNFITGQKKKKHIPGETLMPSEAVLERIKLSLKELQASIEELLKSVPATRQKIKLLCTIPGVSTLLACHILVYTNEFKVPLIPKKFSSYLGMCPHKYESGTSVYKKTRSRQFGPSLMRKMLHLAALSVRTHKQQFREYYLRKVAEGKPKMLVLNNLKNKIIKLMAAILRENKPFSETYMSISPVFLKEALTKS